MRNFWHFIQYHNAVPIAIGIIFLGSGITFAATNPQAIYSQTQQVVAIDNTYLVNKDLSTYSPQVQITGVTEDADNYYVAYKFSTIDLAADSVWKDVVKDDTMTVTKADLGPYRDLGVYVTQQLKQNVDRELARLRDTQDMEKKSVSQKTVATTYGGLIGKLLDSSTETLPGYVPVVTGPPETPQQVAAAAASDSGSSQAGGTSGGQNSGGSSQKIGLQLLGNNPAVINSKVSYIDLGAVLIDPFNTNVGVHVFQDGGEVISPSVDTSTTSVHVIEYRATDPGGSTIVVRRIILIGGAADPGGEISTAGNTTISAPVSAPADTTATTTPPVTPPAATTTPSVPPPPATTAPDTSATTTPPDTAPVATSTPDTSATTTPPVDTSATATDASSTSPTTTTPPATSSTSTTP